MPKLNVLITGAGGTNGMNVLKALEGKGYNLISGDADELSVGLYMTKRRYIFPKASDVGFIPAVMQVCKFEKIDIIIPTHSADILALSEFTEGFKELGLRMCLSRQEVYILTENKVICSKVLKEMGIYAPKLFDKKVKFPAIVKPISSTGTKNTHRVNNQEELEFHFKDKERMFASEFIEGQEYTIDGLSDLKGKVIATLPITRIEAKGGLCTKGRTIKDKELSDLSKKIAEKFEMVGCWNIQFIRNKKGTYCIDINNRFPSGGLPLAVASGLNMPDLMIKMLMGEKVKVKLEYGLTLLRYWSGIIIDKNHEVIK